MAECKIRNPEIIAVSVRLRTRVKGADSENIAFCLFLYEENRALETMREGWI